MSNLQVPGFDDFLLWAGPERMEQWAEDGNAALKTFNPLPPLLNQDGPSAFATALCAANQRMTIAMLRDYHEWLIAQLGQRSLHLLK